MVEVRSEKRGRKGWLAPVEGGQCLGGPFILGPLPSRLWGHGLCQGVREAMARNGLLSEVRFTPTLYGGGGGGGGNVFIKTNGSAREWSAKFTGFLKKTVKARRSC